MITLHEAAKQAIWKAIEQYRTSGGREEHWRNRDALDITIDEALRSALEEATTKELPSGSVTRCRKCGETVEVAFLYAKNEAPKITFLDAEAAFQSRIGIDETPYDRESFLAGYEQGKYDEEMRQGPNFAAPTQRIPENCGSSHCSCIECLKTPEPGLFINMIAQHDGLAEELKAPESGEREALIAKLRNGYQGIQLGAEGMGWGFDIDTLMKVADMLESDAPFEPDWVNYKNGFEAGKAEAIPDGYVLVPIAPTVEMMVALMCTGLRHAEYKSGCDPTIAHLAQGYTEMLAAAPKGEA